VASASWVYWQRWTPAVVAAAAGAEGLAASGCPDGASG